MQTSLEKSKIRMGSQPRDSREEEDNRNQDVHRLHRTKQMLPRRSLPAASHRPDRRLYYKMHSIVIPRCVFGILSDKNERRRPGKDSFHNSTRGILLHHNAFWPEKRRSHLSAHDAKKIENSDRQKHINLRRRHSNRVKKRMHTVIKHKGDI